MKEEFKKSLSTEPFFDEENSIFNQLFSGVTGDKLLLKLLYVVMASCKLPCSLGALVAASSSSGKSYLVNYVATLFPESWVIRVSKISPAVLPKFDELFFQNKILLLDEAEGRNAEVAYIFRVLQSELKYEYWVADFSRSPSAEIIYGPITLVETTSDDPNSHKEDNINRSFVLETDQSKEQTQRILRFQAKQAAQVKSSENKDLIEKHRKFQESLSVYPISIPFAEQIVMKSPHLNARRDFPKVLDIVKTICHLRQQSKEFHQLDDGTLYLQADIEDYRLAYPLLEFAFKATVNKNDQLREHYDDLKKFIKKNESFTRRDIEEWFGFGRTKAKIFLKDLLDYEFIAIIKEARSNQPARYQLNKNTPDSNSILVKPDELVVAWGSK